MSNYNQARSAKDKIDLLKNIKKKIETTMIGALSSIEDHFSFLFKDNEEMLHIYQKLRSEILDKGNKQIRFLEIDLENYVISKENRKTIPVNNKE